MKFISRQIVEKDSSLALVRDGTVQPLTLGEDAYFSTRVDLSQDEIKAPLVFVGYGLNIPEKNYNDLAGTRSEGEGGRVHLGFACGYSVGLVSALPDGGRALEVAPGSGRDWRGCASRIRLRWMFRGRACR